MSRLIPPLIEKVLISTEQDKKQSRANSSPDDQAPSFHFLWVNHIKSDGPRHSQSKERKTQEAGAINPKHGPKQRQKRQA